MGIKIRDIFDSILPNGDAFKPKPGGFLDKLYDGICYIIEQCVIDCKKISNVTNPYLTDMLDDLEREYGLINDPSLSDEEKRSFLNVFAFGKNGKGDALFLQGRLRSLGSDFSNIFVSDNDPPIDPNTVISGEYRMYAGDENAYAGSGNAYAGQGAGELLVDGINTYIIPSDERQNYVFFVGGRSTGYLLINDYDMEKLHCNYWTPGYRTLLVKDTTLKNTGLRSLVVANNGNDEEQEVFPVDNISIYMAYLFYDLKQDQGRNSLLVGNILQNNTFPNDQILNPWYITGNFDYEIEPCEYGQYSGSNKLSLHFNNSISDRVSQNCLTIGEEYTISGWYQQGGIGVLNRFAILDGENVIFLGNSSNAGPGEYEYRYFYLTFIANTNILSFSVSNNSGVSNSMNIGITNILLKLTRIQNILSNGNFILNLNNWNLHGNFSYSILYPPSSYLGLGYSNRILSDTSPDSYPNSYLESDEFLTIGKKYRIQFMCYYDGENYPILRCGSSVIYEGATEGPCSIDFIANGKTLILSKYNNSGHTEWCDISVFELDYFTIKNISPVNISEDPAMEFHDSSFYKSGNSALLSKNSICYSGFRSLKIEYNGVNFPYAYIKRPLQSIDSISGYRISGYFKGNTGVLFYIMIGNSTVYNYTCDDSWIYFNFIYSCQESGIIKFFHNNNTPGGYVLLDQLSVVPILPTGLPYTRGERSVSSTFVNNSQGLLTDKSYNILHDGNCDDISLLHWDEITGNNSYKDSSIFDPDSYQGSSNGIRRSLVVVHNNEYGFGSVRQTTLEPGRIYKLDGKFKLQHTSQVFYVMSGGDVIFSSGINGPHPQKKFTFDINVKEDSDSTDWQEFSVVFNAVTEVLSFKISGSIQYPLMWIDSLKLEELSPINYGGINRIKNIGRTIDLTGESNPYIHIINPYDSYFEFIDIGVSFSIWIYIEDFSSKNILISDDFSITIGEYVLFKYGLVDVYSFDKVQICKWNNIIITYKYGIDPLIKMYINGLSQNISPSIGITGSINFESDIYIYDCLIHSFFIYKTCLSYDECKSEYNNGITVLQGGYINREKNSGTKNISEEIIINNTKISSNIIMNAIDFNGESCGIFNVTGSGDDIEQDTFEYSSDKSLIFNSGKILEIEDNSIGNISYDSNNNIIIRLYFKLDGDAELISKIYDSDNYWKLNIISDCIVFSAKHNGGTEYSLVSEIIAEYSNYIFAEIIIDISSFNMYIFINGKNKTNSNSFNSESDFSNNGTLKIGNNSNCNISYISIFQGRNWFE